MPPVPAGLGERVVPRRLAQVAPRARPGPHAARRTLGRTLGRILAAVTAVTASPHAPSSADRDSRSLSKGTWVKRGRNRRTRTSNARHETQQRELTGEQRESAGAVTASGSATTAKLPGGRGVCPLGLFGPAPCVCVCPSHRQHFCHGRGLCHKLFSQNNNARKKKTQNFLFFPNILSTLTNHLFVFSHESFQFLFSRVNHVNLSLIIV